MFDYNSRLRTCALKAAAAAGIPKCQMLDWDWVQKSTENRPDSQTNETKAVFPNPVPGGINSTHS